jgi:serpin B
MSLARTLSAAALVLLAAVACSGESPEESPERSPDVPGDPLAARRLPDEIRPDAVTVVQGNNVFAFEMYRSLGADEKGNLFFSPFSISTAFAMVYAGARGETGSEIARVFHFSNDQGRLHPVYREILRSLNTGAGFQGYRLNIANRLWGEKNFNFAGEYLGVTREQYGAELETVSFQADPEAERQRINGWVEEKTEEKITDLFPAGSINQDTRLVLANAIYFKGNWESPFDPQETSQQPFQVSVSEQVTVPLMHLEETFRTFREEDGLQILELPYAGKDLSMIVLLPGAVDGLEALEEKLTAEKLDAWRNGLRETKIVVYLPKFTFTSQFSLNQKLSAMGMPTAFSDQADLSGMNGTGGLFIQSALHKAFVNVNEEGTEAAAATGVGVGVTSMPPTFRADHPFLFVIMDNVTGSVLFVGRVVNPAA